jgi:hypothetical protein
MTPVSKPLRKEQYPEEPIQNSSEKLTDPNNQSIQVDAHIADKAKRLLGENHTGDEHYPGEENVKRISIHKDLPRRT